MDPSLGQTNVRQIHFPDRCHVSHRGRHVACSKSMRIWTGRKGSQCQRFVMKFRSGNTMMGIILCGCMWLSMVIVCSRAVVVACCHLHKPNYGMTSEQQSVNSHIASVVFRVVSRELGGGTSFGWIQCAKGACGSYCRGRLRNRIVIRLGDASPAGAPIPAPAEEGIGATN